jgi:hypothetical protein
MRLGGKCIDAITDSYLKIIKNKQLAIMDLVQPPKPPVQVAANPPEMIE